MQEVYGFTVDQYDALYDFLSYDPDKQSAFKDLFERDVSNPNSPFYRIKDLGGYQTWVSNNLEDAEFDGFLAWSTFVIGKSQGSVGN